VALSYSGGGIPLVRCVAEYYSAMTAARDALHYRDLAADFGYTQNGPTRMHSDSKSAIDMSLDPVAFKKTKHIMRAAHFLRDLVARRFIELCKIAGEENVSDLLTKPVSLPVFRKLSRALIGAAEL
jgi:hypothetical protein